ncbi:replicative DNA helicase [Rhizohabitans arisaemae]|uniref:replicative DNA helicase n=1 Tax=Rhizohabitans arisaemae TaxID=2720610 RepID=UPI0024B20F26|nr:replicative DNA helicase [Rhizohabitans arisaemae]
MSIAEPPVFEAAFERTPPNNMEAEQCVLGGMLLSKDAIADVVEVIRSEDFYRPAHQMVFDMILDLYGRGEPADPVTVANELGKRGELARVGGAPYLHTLLSAVPTAANAGYYAKIVREQAVMRRLIEAGTRIVGFGYGGSGEEVDELVDRAQAEIYAVTERRTSEDYRPLSEIMPGALDEIEAIGSRSGQMVGVPTGFRELDNLMNGLHPGQMIVVAARPAIGKALALDTPLPTPTGWTTMGEVRTGDQLIGADGRPTRVVAATEVMTGRPCFEVEFSDGTVVVADAEHQWLTDTRSARRAAGKPMERRRQSPFPAVKTTAEIADTLRCATADRRPNHSVALANPLDLPERTLPLPPYLLGAWLGAGRDDGEIVASDPELGVHLTAEGRHVGRTPTGYRICPDCGVEECRHEDAGLRTTLAALDVLAERHIPAGYLRGSAAQRRALLAGLLDTRGRVNAGGTVHFIVAHRRLAEETRELILSLGYRATMTTRPVRRGGTRHTVTFTPGDKVFRLTGKIARQCTREHPTTLRRYITDVRPIESVPVRCVEVDNADHLYLASRAWIPTHNSTLGLDFARSAAIKHHMTTVVFSLEMSRNEITMRLLSAEAQVALHSMRSGTMSDEDWTRLARRMSEVAEAPLFIDDSPNMSMMEIRAKCRRLKQRHDLRFVIVDYLQLMSSPKRTESRQQEVSEISRALKLLAKELEVPVIAISQLNRGPEMRQDKRPQVSDLRESGSIEQDADVVILLHREDAYERESPRAGEADLIVAKHRNGPTQTVTVAFQGHYSRFVDMAH